MNAEQIAAGLSPAQRRNISRGRFPDFTAYNREHPVFSAMVRKGLLEFRHIIAGKGDFHITTLGQSVRAILKEQDDANT